MIFFQKNHRLVVEKLLNYFDTLAENTYYSTSNAIVIDDNDSLFTWLSDKIGVIKEEDIHPFIYYDLRQYAYAGGPENINYNLNIHTSIYQFFLRLKQYTEKISDANDMFIFPRPNP